MILTQKNENSLEIFSKINFKENMEDRFSVPMKTKDKSDCINHKIENIKYSLPKLNKSEVNFESKNKKKILTNKLKSIQIFEEAKNDINENPPVNPTNFQESLETTQKKSIIDNIDKISITQWIIGQNFPFDTAFLDILCINCSKCLKYYEVDKHSENCITTLKYNSKLNKNYPEEDLNTRRIYKLYQNLKNEKNFLKDKELFSILTNLKEFIYEIFINNNVK